MAHNMIVGMTESGKTTLAVLLCKAFKSKGIRTAVLDPLRDPRWDADFVTADSAEFMAWARANKSAMLFVDEGGQSIGRYNTEMEWLATQARHWGHCSWFLTQRASMIPATIRHQCSKVFMFAVSTNDAKVFADEWNELGLKMLDRFRPGEFVIVSRFEKMKHGRLTFPTGPVYYSSTRKGADASDSGDNRNDESGDTPDGMRSGTAGTVESDIAAMGAEPQSE